MNAALLVFLFGVSALAYPALPDRIPVHFDVAGRPDGWTDRNALAWFTLPLIGVGLVVIMYGSARVMRRFPRLVNMPDRKRFLALSDDGKQRVMQSIEAILHWTVASILILFCALQWGAAAVAIRGESSFPWYVLATLYAVVAGLTIVATPLVIWYLHRSVRRASEDERAKDSEQV